jgi:hypothetical protein
MGLLYSPMGSCTHLDVLLSVSDFHSYSNFEEYIGVLQSVESTCWSTIGRSLLQCLARIGPGRGALLLLSPLSKAGGAALFRVGELEVEVSLAVEAAPLWVSPTHGFVINPQEGMGKPFALMRRGLDGSLLDF